MADKLLLVTMFVMLTLPDIGSANRLPLWFTILVLSRDIAIVLTVAVVNLAVGRRTFRPSIFGKIATATYIDDGRHHAVLQLPRRPFDAVSRSSSTPRSPSRSSRPSHYLMQGRHRHGALTTASQILVRKYSSVFGQPFFEADLRLPAEQRAGARDVGLAHLRVVVGSGR